MKRNEINAFSRKKSFPHFPIWEDWEDWESRERV